MVGVFTLGRNFRSATNILFGLLCLALIGWTTANYFSLTFSNPANIFLSIKAVFAFVVLQNTAYLLFVRGFPSTKADFGHIKLQVYIAFSAVVFFSVLTGLIFKGYSTDSEGNFELQPSPLIAVFITHALLSIIGGLKILVSRIRRASGLLYRQLLFLLTASILLFVFVPLTNFIFPIALKNNSLVGLSPIYTTLFASIIAYSIFRHRLFDIRLLVARTAAYVLLLATLILLFGIGVFGVSSIISGQQIPQTISITYTILAIVLAFTLAPLKRYFDRITNKLFYRDAYDTQELLNELNTVLVSTIDLEPLLKRSAKIIATALKSDYCAFAVYDSRDSLARVISDNDRKIHEAELLKVRKTLHSTKKKVIITDELEEQNHHLGEVLRQNNISLVVRLQNASRLHSPSPGYLLLGPKLSGGIYTEDDAQVITIIADELVIAIQNALRLEEIEHFNLTLQQKIESATKDLREANARLRALDKAKDEFISLASHQLRTPLTTVKGYLSMVLDGETGKVKKEQRELIERAFDGAERMVFLIGDLLNISRLQSGKFTIENQETDLVRIVESEVNQLQETAESHKLKLEFHKPDKFPKLMVDETKMRQVIMNFMDNAIYYTPAGGSVTVDLRADDKSITYTVTDTGLGVPKSQQHKLFSKFYRADNARKMRPDGTGLGLYMARRVVAAQGGAIIFKSAEGKGSTFGFSYPRSKVEFKH